MPASVKFVAVLTPTRLTVASAASASVPNTDPAPTDSAPSATVTSLLCVTPPERFSVPAPALDRPPDPDGTCVNVSVAPSGVSNVAFPMSAQGLGMASVPPAGAKVPPAKLNRIWLFLPTAPTVIRPPLRLTSPRRVPSLYSMVAMRLSPPSCVNMP